MYSMCDKKHCMKDCTYNNLWGSQNVSFYIYMNMWQMNVSPERNTVGVSPPLFTPKENVNSVFYSLNNKV